MQENSDRISIVDSLISSPIGAVYFPEFFTKTPDIIKKSEMLKPNTVIIKDTKFWEGEPPTKNEKNPIFLKINGRYQLSYAVKEEQDGDQTELVVNIDNYYPENIKYCYSNIDFKARSNYFCYENVPLGSLLQLEIVSRSFLINSRMEWSSLRITNYLEISLRCCLGIE